MNGSTRSTNWKKWFSFLIFQLWLALVLSNAASGTTALIPVSGTKDPGTIKALDCNHSSGQTKTNPTANNPPKIKENPSTKREYYFEPAKINTTYEYDQLGRLIRKKTVVKYVMPQ